MNKNVVTLLLTLLLSGCGQSGALYLPNTTKPSPATTTSDIASTSNTNSNLDPQALAGEGN